MPLPQSIDDPLEGDYSSAEAINVVKVYKGILADTSDPERIKAAGFSLLGARRLTSFIRRWRQHFLDRYSGGAFTSVYLVFSHAPYGGMALRNSMKPQHMPSGWDVNYICVRTDLQDINEAMGKYWEPDN